MSGTKNPIAATVAQVKLPQMQAPDRQYLLLILPVNVIGDLQSVQLKAVALQGEVLRHAVYVCDGDCVLRSLKVGGLFPLRNPVNILIRLLQDTRDLLDRVGNRTETSKQDCQAMLFCNISEHNKLVNKEKELIYGMEPREVCTSPSAGACM